MHYKNRKPKPFKGHCTLCSYRSTNGRRNGRIRKYQELVAALSEKEQIEELEVSVNRMPQFAAKHTDDT